MLTLIDHVLYEALPYGFFALALVLTFRYLRLIDLTFAASFALAPAVMAWALVQGFGFAVGTLGGLLLVLFLALFTVFLIQRLEVDGLLAGIVAGFAGYAGSLLFTRGSVSLRPFDTPIDRLKDLDFGLVVGVVPLHPWQVGTFLLLVGLAKLATDHFLDSQVGLAFRAMEDQDSSQHLLPSLGFSPARLQAGGIVAGNLLCAFSGLIVALKESQVTAGRGFDALITVIAAYLLGVTLFERKPLSRSRGKAGAVLQTLRRLRVTTAGLVGIVFYFVVLYAVSLLDVPASAPRLLVVAMLVGAFALARAASPDREVEGRRSETVRSGNGVLAAKGVRVADPGWAGPVEVLSGVSLEVRPGELVHLTGENGSGKTTLLRFLAGQLPGEGEVRVPTTWDGNGLAVDRRRSVAYVPQKASESTCATLTAEEHLALYAVGSDASSLRSWRRGLARRRINVDAVALRTVDSTPVGVLSGGQRQLMSVSSLNLRPAAPEVVLIDEPLTHLDEVNAHACVALIGELLREGRCVVLVQHDLRPPQAYPSPDRSARAELSRLVTRRMALPATEKGGDAGSSAPCVDGL